MPAARSFNEGPPKGGNCASCTWIDVWELMLQVRAEVLEGSSAIYYKLLYSQQFPISIFAFLHAKCW